ncbi:large extracellular alpha-helical protein [Methanolobus tindarius DSM 2278]|uniref:Large extracellular alpha-helical protein n=1 Tax=Methanolobus tindarius DSM 2278 TaxID=1090322 RepID=W9DWL3_METTI|nr:alpha-2-macroglobulin family protein [Methanolobus tindarius]ETA67826.1 large extracellular alpha-helical protein [Methanolobus tindarius DSM 2278]
MNLKGKKTGSLIIIVSLFAVIISGCVGSDDLSSNIAGQCGGQVASSGDEFLILAPKMLFSGGESSITMAAFSDNEPVERCVEYTLTDENNNEISLVQASTSESGNVVASFEVPDVEEGTYTLTAKPTGYDTEFEATVTVVNNNPLFIETDKPIYKPGQTINGRIVSLNNNLVPVQEDITVEITDAKGIKVFKEELNSNEYGVVSFDLPLASELNLGTWKITAKAGDSSSMVDIQVDKYVLPKFDVSLETPQEWFLVSDEITGTVSANYFFGKVVEGDVLVEASRYVGKWEQYATFSGTLENGSIEFELPEVEYAAGTYGAGGQASLMLNVTVTDTGNHSESTNKLLTIAESPLVIQLIPESSTIKPGMPLQVLIVTKDPGGNPVDAEVTVETGLRNDTYDYTSDEFTLNTEGGVSMLELDIPENSTSLDISAHADDAWASEYLYAAYSPSASFIHITQTSDGVPEVGDTISFHVYSTNPGTVFYDVFANGRTVYSATSDEADISIPVTPQMSPQAKVVAYMINPNSEVSVDVLPFDVEFSTQVDFSSSFSSESAEPGDDVTVDFDTGSKSMIGFSIVDESVYALSEGRLNLKQVFDELEIRFMEPQAESHPRYMIGAYDALYNEGVVVMSSPGIDVPESRDVYQLTGREVVIDGANFAGFMMDVDEEMGEEMPAMAMEADSAKSVTVTDSADDGELAEVQRVRQFFPETWVWMPELLTDEDGLASVDLNAPDSITTWRLHAVSTGPEGIGISESSLTVFQDFFVDPDLPYSVTRGEEFPVQVQVYNYLDTEQDVKLTLSGANWFKIIGDDVQTVTVDGNGAGYISFTISPTKVGKQIVEITGQTTERADAVRKDIIVEAEGTTREIVDNGVLSSGSVELDTTLPADIVSDSEKILVSFTPSIVAQSISGVDDLLGMPYGCGEQNMMLFSTDVEVLRYLKATGQDNPEVRAKAEMYIITGYQRELTYRHSDGSFSAFGESDENGSLWLTSFVLSQFSAARDVTTIDENILSEAADWIESYQQEDGSWEQVGFVIHQDMMGGVSGTYALTAYTTLALEEYGSANPVVMSKAQQYLEDNLAGQDDPYALAIGTLALQKLDSSMADEALIELLAISKQDEDGMYWGYGDGDVRLPYEHGGYGFIAPSSKNVETTAYATLALIEANNPSATSSLKWIAAQRNSNGGFSSTQDTVMAFRALMSAAASAGRDIDATVHVIADGTEISSVEVNQQNFDVVQIIEIPDDVSTVTLSLEGTGDLNYQLVRRFNVILPDVVEQNEIELDVEYDSTDVSVNDIVTVNAHIKYNGITGIDGTTSSSGMMIVDLAVPTGFSPVTSSLEATKASEEKITLYEIAGRKVIFYIDDMQAGEELNFSMQVQALFPVKAVVSESKAYSYYNPEVVAEVKGMNVTVV